MTPERTPTEIDAIAESWVDTELDLFPEMRVYVGRPGREGEYHDYSPAGADAAADAVRATLATVRAARPVDDVDEVTQRELIRVLELDLERHAAGTHYRSLDVIASPAQEIRDIFDLMPTEQDEDWSHIAERMRNVEGAIGGYVETLRAGIGKGIVPAVRQVEEVIEQITPQIGPKGFFQRFAAQGGDEHHSLAAELQTAALQADAAYVELLDFLKTELAPSATPVDAVGRDLYQLESRGFLGATIDLDETYEWGVDELARMSAEQERIANEILPGASVQEAIEHLAKDESRKLHGTEALREWMQAKSDQAIEELGRSHFDIPEPVRRLECLIAPTQTGGIYYTGPTEDFSRAGRMWWSVPAGVTEFETWRELTTVYHEGVPGHHLQIGQATYNSKLLNSWRRNNFTSGHGEGWALYAERLMEQLGYLEDPADRLGMLDGQRLRALRVVLDLGVHLGKPRLDGTGGWDFDYALEQMRQNVNMNEPFLRFETLRYFGWPAQAPAYKVGQRYWERLRDEAREREGAAFDIKAWHRRALDLGGVGLETLEWALAR